MAERAAERGFTLIEVLAALVVLSLALGAAYAAFGTGGAATTRAEAALEALARAENGLAAIGSRDALIVGETERRDSDGWRTRIEVAPYRPEAAAQWERVGLRPLIVAVAVEGPGGGSARLETLRLESLR